MEGVYLRIVTSRGRQGRVGLNEPRVEWVGTDIKEAYAKVEELQKDIRFTLIVLTAMGTPYSESFKPGWRTLRGGGDQTLYDYRVISQKGN